jgi:hypothetical protein
MKPMSTARICALLVCVLGVLQQYARGQSPEPVSACDLQNKPSAYNHKLISVEGFVSHDFEDFTLFDPSCHDLSVWLDFGGTAASNTMYCCGVVPSNTRSKPLVVEGIPIPLVDDAPFRQFDREIQPPFRSGKFGSIVHAKLIGRFFAGHDGSMRGYGHMGCCSLLAIQQVVSVDLQNRDYLDYAASPDQPDVGKECYGYQELAPIFPDNEIIQAQRKADSEPSTRVFDDPEAVARDYLMSGKNPTAPRSLKLTVRRKGNGRIVYDGIDKSSGARFMIVVSRPYVLSFYARDPKRVAWVPIAAYKLSCE